MNIIQYLQKFIPALCYGKNKILLLLAGFICFQQVQGQTDKNYVLAEQYFAAGEYLTAAGLYEQFLHPPVKKNTGGDFPLFANRHSGTSAAKTINKLDVLYKQAESYRLANYWPQASARYKECFEKDRLKYATALYWYATSQRSIGNYDEAEQSLNSFLNIAGDDPLQPQAKKELETLQVIRQQLARPDSVLYSVQKISTQFSGEKGAYAPIIHTGDRLLLTSAVPDSVVKKDINPYHNRIFLSNLSEGSIQNIKPVEIEGLDISSHQGAASLSADGRYLYFTQWKKENGKNISAIYYSTKKGSGWSSPVLLPLVNQENFNSKQPFCTADGKYLFFASDRPGGSGEFDIWWAPLQTGGTTGEPVNAGSAMNTSADEQSPFYHASSHTLVFSSNRSAGMGGYDLYTAKGNEKNWEQPVNMGHPVNSSRDDLYFYAPSNGSLLSKAMISSDRGSDCCLELYAISKSPKQKKLKGHILDCRTNERITGAEVILKNANGDSIVASTAADGSYEFDITASMNDPQLLVRKTLYKESTEPLRVGHTDESGWLTDMLMSIPVCLEKKLVIKVENVVTVYFDFDKSGLKQRGIEQLDSIHAILSENPVATLQISGYTDGLGSVDYNKKLSDRRAKACADYLISKGIDPGRISFESFGACCPIEMELINGRDNPDGRSKNRRALINISRE